MMCTLVLQEKPSKGASNGIRREKGVNDERRASCPGVAERGVQPCGERGSARTGSEDDRQGGQSEFPRHERICLAGWPTHPAGDGHRAILSGLHDTARHRQKLAATTVRTPPNWWSRQPAYRNDLGATWGRDRPDDPTVVRARFIGSCWPCRRPVCKLNRSSCRTLLSL